MTEQLSKDSAPEPTSGDGAVARGRYGRRALILGAAAGAGAAVTLASRAAPAEAGPAYVVLGGANSETVTTTITNANSGGIAGITSANGGHTGVHGNDTSSGGGYGVAGNSVNGTGVSGETTGNMQSGVLGSDGSPDGAYGVQGFTRVGTGVYGTSNSNGIGVLGDSSYIGVQGNSEFGTGVYASSSDGYALQTSGTAQFSGQVQFSTSGVATVPKNSQTVTVELAGMTTSSIVLATIQKAYEGIAIEAATPASGSFTITLTAKAPAKIPVGWFVIG